MPAFCPRRLIRVFISGAHQAGERAAFGDLDRSSQRGRKVAEQAVHVFRGLDKSFTVGEESESRVVNRTAVTNASEHILERLPMLIVIVDLIGGKKWNAVGAAYRFGMAQHHSVQRPIHTRRAAVDSPRPKASRNAPAAGVDRNWIRFADLWINGPAKQAPLKGPLAPKANLEDEECSNPFPLDVCLWSADDTSWRIHHDSPPTPERRAHRRKRGCSFRHKV